jgi:hypothetical protein
MLYFRPCLPHYFSCKEYSIPPPLSPALSFFSYSIELLLFSILMLTQEAYEYSIPPLTWTFSLRNFTPPPTPPHPPTPPQATELFLGRWVRTCCLTASGRLAFYKEDVIRTTIKVVFVNLSTGSHRLHVQLSMVDSILPRSVLEARHFRIVADPT